MWSAIAVTARRTVANVKSSAIRPRQPEVPNLMGETAMAGYCTWVRIVHKDEDARQKDAPTLTKQKMTDGEGHERQAVPGGISHLRIDCRGTKGRTQRGRKETGRLREYCAQRGVDL